MNAGNVVRVRRSIVCVCVLVMNAKELSGRRGAAVAKSSSSECFVNNIIYRDVTEVCGKKERMKTTLRNETRHEGWN